MQPMPRVPAFATVRPFANSSAGMIGQTARARYNLKVHRKTELLLPDPPTERAAVDWALLMTRRGKDSNKAAKAFLIGRFAALLFLRRDADSVLTCLRRGGMSPS